MRIPLRTRAVFYFLLSVLALSSAAYQLVYQQTMRNARLDGDLLPTFQAQGGITVQHATLSEDRLIKRLTDLKEGESVFTTPDAMVVDESRKVWLNPYSVIVEESTGFKVSRKKDGFHVESMDKKVRWIKIPLEHAVPDAKIREKLIPVRTIKLEPLK